MSKLQAALDWAERGFKVFPLRENGRTPAFKGNWLDWATTDPDTIRRYWTDSVTGIERNYNIGADCSGRVVFDLDVKSGKDGYNEYLGLGGQFDTLCVRTPSGGFHLYYEGPESANVSPTPGIDIRSHHGYVACPGSVIDGRPYEICIDRSPSFIPVQLEPCLTDPYHRTELATIALDTPAALQGALNFLQSAPPAIEGQRGDDTTFKTCARLVREFGLSEEAAFNLLWEEWNPRCLPPWDYEELQAKVLNASQYGSADFGKMAPEIMFSAVPPIEPPPNMFTASGADWGNTIELTDLQPRPWMLDKILMLRELTLLVAPGGAGKSSLSLALAAHMALGLNFGKYHMHRKCKAIVYNGEDDIEEQTRRLVAVCQSYNLPYNEVRKNILLLTSTDIDLTLVSAQGGQAIINTPVVNQLIELASDPEVGLLVLDPLVDLHNAKEEDNAQMNVVMKTLKHVVAKSNTTGLIMHHTSKQGSSRLSDRTGNMDIARGASGIVNKVRIAYTMSTATDEDLELYGLQKDEQNSYVRLDDAKMQFTLKNGTALWFKKEPMRIITGDIVGVLHEHPMQEDVTPIRMRVANMIIEHLEIVGHGSMQITQAVAIVKEREPLYADQSSTKVKEKIEGMLATPVIVGEKRIQCIRDDKGSRPVITLV